MHRVAMAATALLASLANSSPILNTTDYEYVVVGSGPGGGPLAANLARAGHSVFLIEAGGDLGEDISQLSPVRIQPEDTRQAWGFFVNHYQDEIQARRDHKFTYRFDNGSYYVGTDPPEGAEPAGILYPRGATVGGSSQINAMNVALPPANDWEYIAELTGDDSWHASEMRQHFIDLERNAFFPPGTPGHGFDGYVSSNFGNISHVLDREGLSVVLREGIRILEEIEVEDDAQLAEILLRDVNSPDTSLYHGDGVGFFQMPVHKNATNRRTGAYTHIKNTLDARDEEGNPLYPLTLSMHSLATKILFDTHRGKPKAVGLEYLVGEAMYGADSRYNESNTGELRTVTASQEVIIAGGAFNTPQILKLSGVGPRAELEQHQIPVVKDLPAVGNYMQDNYEGGVSVRAPVTWEDNPLETEGCDPSLPEDPCMIRWLEDGSGPYGDSAPSIFTFRSSVSENEDADIIAFGFVNGRFTGFYPGYSSDAGVLGDVQGSSWSLVKMQTGNTAGTVELRSSNPREPPSINFNYFQEQGDRNLQVLAEGTEFVIEMLNAVGEPYTPLELLEPVPGVDTRQSLMDQTFSHHVTSTCRMGRKDDPDYCVDSKFRVNGIEGLQVVDASVFPRTPGGFPVAPTFIIGQKAFRTIVSELEIL